jgi:hypothetical protein
LLNLIPVFNVCCTHMFLESNPPWAEPEGPTRSTPLRPSRGPLEPIRAQALASHGQHGLSAAATFLGVRATPRGPAHPYKAAASTASHHPCVRRRLRRAPPAATSIRKRGVPPEQGDTALSSVGSSRTPSAVSRHSLNVRVSSPLKDQAEPPELRRRPIPPASSRPCHRWVALDNPLDLLPHLRCSPEALDARGAGDLEPPMPPVRPFHRFKKAPAVLQLGPCPFQ